MRKFIAVLILLCGVICAPADARVRGTVADVFNGGRSQIGVNFLQIANDYAFMNAVKGAQTYTYVDNSDAPDPSELSVNGYPIPGSNCFSHGGVYTVFYVPLQSERPGNYVATWDGISNLYTGMSNTVLPSATFTGSVTAGILTAGAPSATIQKGMQIATLGGIIGDQITGSAGAAGTYYVTGLTTAASQSMTVNGGSKTGSLATGNRYVFSTTDYRFSMGFAAATQTPSNLRVFHVDDEAELDAGQVLGKKFRQVWAYMNAGVIRFMDWQPGNTTNVTTWATRKPVDYVFYNGSEYRLSMWAGETTNVGDSYTAALTPSGWAGLVDKATVIVKFKSNASGDSATLNVAGTGAVPIRNAYGDVTSSGGNTRPVANRFATLIYDATLGVWLKHGGDVANNSQGLGNGVPPEVMLTVATKLGAHPYVTQPYLAADPITDYMSSLASYFRDNGPSWMIPRYEGPNETWNNAAGFYATRYGWNKAFAYWGTTQDTHNWYGKTVSLLGQSISAVYSDNRTKYQLLAGVQSGTACANASCSSSGTSGSNARLTSALFVSSGPAQSGYTQSAAYNWTTHVVQANYVLPSNYRTLQELRDAYAYVVTNDGNPTAQNAIADAYVNTLGGAAANFNLNYVKAAAQFWFAWAQGNWGGSINLQLTAYEGGYTPDYSNSVWTSTLVGATPGSPCALNLPLTQNPGSSQIAGNPAVIGMSVTPSGVTGMTQLNGNTYTVNGVTGNSVTINVDCSAFTAVPSATVALTIASPGVVNWTSHGRSADERIAFTTTGSLPTGLTANVNYFVKTVLDANSFTVSSDAGGTVINFTGSQSGVQTATGGGLVSWVSSPLYTNTLRWASKFRPDLQTQMTQHYSDMAAVPMVFPSHFFLSGASVNPDTRLSGGVIGAGQVWGLYDQSIYATPYSPAVESIRLFNINWLLKRDLNPAANDNDPMWLEKAA
jgi:hypothetical protein